MGQGKGLENLLQIYASIKPQIVNRLNEFKTLWESGDEEGVFKELIFCLLTPQSKAEVCWRAVENLDRKGLLLEGAPDEIAEELIGVRFRFNKAKYIVEAREKFAPNKSLRLRSFIAKFDNVEALRDWLVKNVKGLGYKEASHFLRNIGWGENLAILDRHILRNLCLVGLIENIPENLSRKTYLDIERKMKDFSQQINIPLSNLDLLLWYKEVGKVFK